MNSTSRLGTLVSDRIKLLYLFALLALQLSQRGAGFLSIALCTDLVTPMHPVEGRGIPGLIRGEMQNALLFGSDAQDGKNPSCRGPCSGPLELI